MFQKKTFLSGLALLALYSGSFTSAFATNSRYQVSRFIVEEAADVIDDPVVHGHVYDESIDQYFVMEDCFDDPSRIAIELTQKYARIGKGATGSVFPVDFTWFRDSEEHTGAHCILKECKEDHTTRKHLIEEYKILKDLSRTEELSPFLPTPYCRYDNQDGNVCMLMKRGGQSLKSFVKTVPGHTLNDDYILTVASKLSYALHYMNKKYNLVHRDIKPENILITPGDRPENMIIEIIDFGTTVEPGSIVSTGGTFYYIPAEAYNSPVTGVNDTHDIFSLGVTLYQLREGQYPQVNLSGRSFSGEFAVMRYMMEDSYRTDLESEINTRETGGDPLGVLIARMMHPDPEQRPAMVEVWHEVARISKAREDDLAQKIIVLPETPRLLIGSYLGF